MSSSERRSSEKDGGGRHSRRGAGTGVRRWTAARPVQVLCLGGVLLVGLLCARLHARHLRPPAPPAAPPLAPTPFESSFAEAQRQYFRAQVIAKRQLEALEEWDSGALRGSAPEVYRRNVISRTREIGLAEAAANEAVRQAKSTDESYQAVRLLAHIECDRGHHHAELELARKLVALRPTTRPGAGCPLGASARVAGMGEAGAGTRPEALLMLARAAAECGQVELARRAASEASRMSGSPPIRFSLPAVPRDRLTHPWPAP